MCWIKSLANISMFWTFCRHTFLAVHFIKLFSFELGEFEFGEVKWESNLVVQSTNKSLRECWSNW